MGAATMHVVTRALACLLIAALSAACGGQSFVNDNSTIPADWPGHGWEDGARQGAFVVVAVDSTERNVVPLTDNLRLETARDAGGTLVTVYGSALDAGSVYLHLKYDAATLHPVEAQPGATLGDEVLFLGITTQPGVAVMGLATVGGGALPAGELQLAQVRFAPGAFADTARGTSDVSLQAPDDLHFI